MTAKSDPLTTSPLAAYRGGTAYPLLGSIDHRSKAALAFRAAVLDFAEDRGGLDRLSRAEVELARRAAAMAVLAARFDERVCNGEDLGVEEVNAYLALANAQGRALGKLGMRRQSHDVTPDLADYIEGGTS